MQSRLFEPGWGNRAKSPDDFRESDHQRTCDFLIRNYREYHRYQYYQVEHRCEYDHIWNPNEGALSDDDQRLKSEVESFVFEVVWNRYWLRKGVDSEMLDSETVYQTVSKYLENPLFYNPTITDYLLVDLLDNELILLERDFHVGLFAKQGINVNTVTLAAYEHGFLPRKSILRSFSWAGLYTLILGILFFKGWEMTQNPSQKWWGLICLLASIPMISLIVLALVAWTISPRRPVRRHVAELASQFQIIRFEIAGQPYHAKTLIERLKELEGKGLGVNSLIYGLLELRQAGQSQ